MRLMMLDPDTFDIRGYVDSRQVMKDLSFTPGKLLHFMVVLMTGFTESGKT